MPGNRVTAEQYERGVMALAGSSLRRLTTEQLAEEMGTGWETAERARGYLESVVETLGVRKDDQLAPAVAAARDICIANAIKPATLARSSTYQLMGAAEAADRIYRLASGKATQHVHHLHEITAREQVARKLVEAGILKDLGILDVGVEPSGAGHEPGNGE